MHSNETERQNSVAIRRMSSLFLRRMGSNRKDWEVRPEVRPDARPDVPAAGRAAERPAWPRPGEAEHQLCPHMV